MNLESLSFNYNLSLYNLFLIMVVFNNQLAKFLIGSISPLGVCLCMSHCITRTCWGIAMSSGYSRAHKALCKCCQVCLSACTYGLCSQQYLWSKCGAVGVQLKTQCVCLYGMMPML